jgi:hypothetical protein
MDPPRRRCARRREGQNISSITTHRAHLFLPFGNKRHFRSPTLWVAQVRVVKVISGKRIVLARLPGNDTKLSHHAHAIH